MRFRSRVTILFVVSVCMATLKGGVEIESELEIGLVGGDIGIGSLGSLYGLRGLGYSPGVISPSFGCAPAAVIKTSAPVIRAPILSGPVISGTILRGPKNGGSIRVHPITGGIIGIGGGGLGVELSLGKKSAY